MNETDLIRKQLATEREHFAQVANTCAIASGNASPEAAAEFVRACADYFAFALTRFDAGPSREMATQLDAARSAGTDCGWRDFLKAFNSESQRRFAALDALSVRTLPVTQWRAACKIDADAILAERALFGRVQATLPAGITLANSLANSPVS